MSEHPPIPGVELGADEQIIDHGTLLGYDWWITELPENDGGARYVADFTIPADHPAAQAYELEDVYRSDIDRVMGIPYNDDVPHTFAAVPGRDLVRITCSSYHISHRTEQRYATVFNHMRSLILGYHQANTLENGVLFRELRDITRTIADATQRRDQLLGIAY